MKTSLSDYLQIWGFDGDNVIFSDGSLGFGLDVVPIEVSTWSGSQINDLSQRISQFLNGLPDGLDLQFIQDITGGNEALIEQHRHTGKDCENPIVSELTESRVSRLSQLDKDGLLPRHLLKLFIRRPMQSALLEKPKFFSRSKQFLAIAEDKLRAEIANLERVKTDVISGLSNLGLTSAQIGVDKLVDLIYWQWNPVRGVPKSGYDPDDIRYSLLFTDVGITDRGFVMGDMHYRVISLKLLPDQTFAAMAQALRGLPFDTRLQLTIRVPNQQRELESLQIQRRIAYSMVSGRRSGVSDLDSEAKFRDLETLLEQMVAQGEKVFHVSLQIVLRSKSLEQLDDLVSQSLMKIRELSGAEGMEETLASFDIFSSIAIPNARAVERTKRVKTSNLCDILPIYGPWPGHNDPKILLRSRLGNLVSFNPFSSDLTNSNQIVSGGSGSGKSFLTNILLMQMLKENPKVFVVDIGGSYKKLCENFDGQYIPLGVESDFSINPFDLAPSEKTPSNQKLKFILSLVEIMTKEDSEARLGKLERAEIEAAIQKVYENSKSPTLSDLRDNLLKHADPQICRYGKILSPWCGNTPYGRFVDRPTTIQLKRPVVCFDLKGMETLPDLQAACLFIITDFVWREVQSDRMKMKFLIFDECWKLLENESGALFIAEVFRTFRKYMASAIAISQNIDDFAKSKVATAILPNSSIKWILKQKGADQERLKTVLSLNESEASLIQSLHQERGSYSEAFLMAEDQRAVVAIESTSLEYWLATTDPRDLSKLESERLEDPNLATIELLKKLAAKYPRGVAAGGVQ